MKANAYKPDEDIEKYMADDPSSELYIQRLAEAGLLKEACDFLCYAIHRRAGVWWGCLRVKDLIEEKIKYKDYKSPLQEKRAATKEKIESFVQQSKDSSAKSKAALAEQQAKIASLDTDLKTKEFTDPDDPRTKLQESMKNAFSGDKLDQLHKQLNDTIAAFSPERKAQFDAALARLNALFIEKNGKPLKELLTEAMVNSLKKPEPSSTPNLAAQKLEANMAEIKASMTEQLANFDLKIPSLPKDVSQKRIDAAYEAALRWVMAPTDINARLACEAGLAAKANVEGILAQTAFWSGHNLAPAKANIRMSPPPGLASRGLLTTLFKCAMSKDGKLSYGERYELHLKIGLEVAQASNLWDEEFKKQVKNQNWDGREGFGRSFAVAADAPATPKTQTETPIKNLSAEEAPAKKRGEHPDAATKTYLEKASNEGNVSFSQTKRNIPIDGSLGSPGRRSTLNLPDNNEDNSNKS